MTFSFKNPKSVALVYRTPEEDLVFCEVCGGINARARASAKIDCTECDGTGYQNLYSRVFVSASLRPGAVTRWNVQAGALDILGECGIKLDGKYKNFLSSTEWIEMDGAEWKFTTTREPGEALGQHRLVLALTRK